MQYAVATPTRAFITVAVMGALMSFGVVSVQWQDGRPKIAVDEKKAAEIKSKGVDWIQEKEAEYGDRLWGGDSTDGSLVDDARRFGAETGSTLGSKFGSHLGSQVGAQVESTLNELGDRYGAQADGASHGAPAASTTRRPRVGIRRD